MCVLRFLLSFFGSLTLNSNSSILCLLKVGSANVQAPQLRPYKTGLIALNKAFIDFVLQKVIHRLLEIENTHFSTVGTYAVIDLGFDILASKNHEMFQPFVGWSWSLFFFSPFFFFAQ